MSELINARVNEIERDWLRLEKENKHLRADNERMRGALTHIAERDWLRLEKENKHLRADNARLREACEIIASLGCENYVAPANCLNSHRVIHTKYSADRICNPCVARAALEKGESDE